MNEIYDVTVTCDDNLWVALVDGVGATDALSRFMAVTHTPRAGPWLPTGRRARCPGVRRGP